MSLSIGQTHTVVVQFLSYDEDTDSYSLIDLTSVTATLAKYNDLTDAYDSPLALGAMTEVSTGIYSYSWLISAAGKFKFVFTGTTNEATPATVLQERVFLIAVDSDITLSGDGEYYFLPELTPLYLDPEELVIYYSEVDLVEAAQIIYSISLELEELLGKNPEITTLVKEYIKAAALCELSKIHVFDGGLSGFGGSDSFTLGDLTVSKNSAGSKGKGSLYRGNATSWCELAALYREELINKNVNMKGVIRGENVVNPVPSRKLRRFD